MHLSGKFQGKPHGLTAHVQPNNAGIIWCFKAWYHHLYISQVIDRYDQGITPSDVYKINQLEAM